MPKGKAKKDNPDMYRGPPEPSERRMTTQATAHRRGGTHKVRDEDRTDSVYDTYNYKELLDAAKERGIYRKDMKKVEMAWALKRNDDEKKCAEQAAITARRRAQQEAQIEQERIAEERQRQIVAKHRRRIEKMEKRERDESVSSDSLSETDIEAEHYTRDEFAREALGQALSDSSWDSTSTESSADSVDHDIKPASRLRLVEWPYLILPSTTAPSPVSLLDPTADPVFQPRQMPYAPLKLMTTHSKQKVTLPGLKYPAGVAPDFAPILPDFVRDTVRKGALTGMLRNAVIETGFEWARRTLVQGWNGHLYFLPAPRRSDDIDAGKAGLGDVYRRWALEERNARRAATTNTTTTTSAWWQAVRSEREKRRQRRRAVRVKRDIEVFETSSWTPGAVGFVPAFLDFGGEERGNGGVEGRARTLEALRYVRFKECDVPHYFFWASEHGVGVGVGAGERDQIMQAKERLDGRNAMVSASEDAEDGGNQAHARFPRKRPWTSYYTPQADDNDTDPALQDITSETSTEEVLYRRSTSSFPCNHAGMDSSNSVTAWLERVSSSYEGPIELLSKVGFVGEVGSWFDGDGEVGGWGWREEKQGTGSEREDRETGHECSFCGVDWRGMGHHVSNVNPSQPGRPV